MDENRPQLKDLARQLRRRLETERTFGWDPPLRPAPPPLLAGTARPAQPTGATAASGSADPAERARRGEALEAVRREVAACTRCELSKSRTRTVFGVGDPSARLLFVGEAPGYDEDRQGEPFVGKAGQLLDGMIRAMRLRRQDVYIANIVKCRPPANRNPDPEEVGSCIPYLRRQIEIVSPEVICCLGAVAARSLLESSLSVARLRGRFHDYRGIPVRVTYHPAYLLRNQGDKRKAWEDLKTVMTVLGIRLP